MGDFDLTQGEMPHRATQRTAPQLRVMGISPMRGGLQLVGKGAYDGHSATERQDTGNRKEDISRWRGDVDMSPPSLSEWVV